MFLVLVAINFMAFGLGKPSPGRTLAILAFCAATLVIISMLTDGPFAMWSILCVGLFNSIMFPTIFTLAIQAGDKSPHKKERGEHHQCRTVAAVAVAGHIGC